VPTPAYSSLDGPRITVDALLKDPLVIPALILDMTQNEFIVDAVLRAHDALAVRGSQGAQETGAHLAAP